MESYIVIELQTAKSGAVANLVTQYASEAEAQSKYHSVLAAAAVSDLPVHGAVLMTNSGVTLENRYYEREA